MNSPDFKILIVCTGNTCRSPMAEGILKSILKDRGITDIEVSSAGVRAVRGAPLHGIKVLNSSGSGTTIINGQPFHWQKGDTFIVPLWSWHEHANASSSAMPKWRDRW